MDEDKKPTEHNEAHTAEPQTPAPGPALDQPVDPTHRQSQTADEHQPHEAPAAPILAKPEPWSRLDKLGLVFDGAVAAATIVGVAFLVLQWDQTQAALWETREANRINREARDDGATEGREQGRRYMEQLAQTQELINAFKDTASATDKSAIALSEGNKLTLIERAERERATEREQRPRFNLFGFRLTMEPPKDKGFRIRVDYTNDGKRDAEQFRGLMAIQLATSTPPIPSWNLNLSPSGTLPPGAKGRYSENETPVVPTPAGLAGYENVSTTPRARLYIWFRAEYCSQGKRYWMQTCMYHLKEREAQTFVSCGTGTTTQGPEEGEPCN